MEEALASGREKAAELAGARDAAVASRAPRQPPPSVAPPTAAVAGGPYSQPYGGDSLLEGEEYSSSDGEPGGTQPVSRFLCGARAPSICHFGIY